MIVLLDLNYTLAVRKHGERQPFADFARCIEVETYRAWLIDLIREQFVILLTARPDRYRDATLGRILHLHGWSPHEAHFNPERFLRPHLWKQRALLQHIFPRHGEPHPGKYIGIESNPQTRAMYARLGIPSVPVGDSPWSSFQQIVQEAASAS